MPRKGLLYKNDYATKCPTTARAGQTPAADAMRATAWRSALFMLGIHAPRAAAELLDVTLTRQWDGGLLGFVLEQSEIGQLIAEVSPGMAADVDESLQPGDVIIGAEGLAEGLFDQASLHECRVLDALPPGTALSSTWHRTTAFASAHCRLALCIVADEPCPFT